jgi:ATP-dependent Lon protease
VPHNTKDNLIIKPVKWIDEVLEIALERSPTPLSDEDYLNGLNDSKTTSSDEDVRGEARATSH